MHCVADDARYITPPGQGFLPKETALHHQVSCSDRFELILRAWQYDAAPQLNHQLVQEHAIEIVRQALTEANIAPEQISCIAYTKVRSPHMWRLY